MNLDEALRLTAGVVLVTAVVLTLTVSPHFIWLVAFVALNLMQSAFTRWCPAMTVLRRFVKSEQGGCAPSPQA